MGNEQKVKKRSFVWSLQNLVVHDRDCHYVRQISQHNKIMSNKKTHVVSMRACKHCKKKLLIRILIADEFVELYRPLFESVDLTVLETLVYEKRIAVISYVDQLHVTCEEDMWKIQLMEDGQVRLWHNNYVPTLDGERHFMNGYHLQIDDRISLAAALHTIARYHYKGSHHSSNFRINKY